MLNFKHLFFVFIAVIFIGCQTENNEVETVVSTEPQIVSSELQSYAITDELIVNSVAAILYNPGEAKNYQYIVTLNQGTETWVDTIAYYANSKDTARHHVIFGESVYSKETPAAFNTQIEPVEILK